MQLQVQQPRPFYTLETVVNNGVYLCEAVLRIADNYLERGCMLTDEYQCEFCGSNKLLRYETNLKIVEYSKPS